MDLGDEQSSVAPDLVGEVPIAYPDPDTESAVTRVYLAVLQHPQPSRSLLIAHGIREDLVDASLRILDAQGLIRLHEGGHLEVVPPDIALPNVAAELEHRARQTRSAAHELAQVYFQARANTIRPDAASLRVLRSMDELAAATADIISTGTERIRCFRSMSPRTRELFAAPLHSHEARSTGVGGVPLDMATTYTTEVLDLDNALQVLEARERGGERFRFVSSVPFSALVVDDTAAVVDTTLFEENGAGSVLVRSRPMVRALAPSATLRLTNCTRARVASDAASSPGMPRRSSAARAVSPRASATSASRRRCSRVSAGVTGAATFAIAASAASTRLPSSHSRAAASQ
jgi:hypothetical protein